MSNRERNLLRGVALSAFILAIGPTSGMAQYVLTRSVIDMAGTVRNSASYRLIDASGQIAADISASPSYVLTSGFLAIGLTPVGIADPGADPGIEISLPRSFALEQNYPNPFNPTTTIRFGIPGSEGEGARVRLEVFNIRGQRVRMLVDDVRVPGTYEVHWDGRTDQGEQLGSGIYLYRISAGDFRATKKMVVTK